MCRVYEGFMEEPLLPYPLCRLYGNQNQVTLPCIEAAHACLYIRSTATILV